MKFGLKSYFLPTPKRMRILGDSLAAASVFIGGFAIINEYNTIAIIVLVLGWLGKFLSNFFA